MSHLPPLHRLSLQKTERVGVWATPEQQAVVEARVGYNVLTESTFSEWQAVVLRAYNEGNETVCHYVNRGAIPIPSAGAPDGFVGVSPTTAYGIGTAINLGYEVNNDLQDMEEGDQKAAFLAAFYQNGEGASSPFVPPAFTRFRLRPRNRKRAPPTDTGTSDQETAEDRAKREAEEGRINGGRTFLRMLLNGRLIKSLLLPRDGRPLRVRGVGQGSEEYGDDTRFFLATPPHTKVPEYKATDGMRALELGPYFRVVLQGSGRPLDCLQLSAASAQPLRWNGLEGVTDADLRLGAALVFRLTDYSMLADSSSGSGSGYNLPEYRILSRTYEATGGMVEDIDGSRGSRDYRYSRLLSRRSEEDDRVHQNFYFKDDVLKDHNAPVEPRALFEVDGVHYPRLGMLIETHLELANRVENEALAESRPLVTPSTYRPRSIVSDIPLDAYLVAPGGAEYMATMAQARARGGIASGPVDLRGCALVTHTDPERRHSLS